jgi:hypothetical protein
MMSVRQPEASCLLSNSVIQIIVTFTDVANAGIIDVNFIRIWLFRADVAASRHIPLRKSASASPLVWTSLSHDGA